MKITALATTHGIMHADFSGLRRFVAPKNVGNLIGNRLEIPYDTMPLNVGSKGRNDSYLIQMVMKKIILITGLISGFMIAAFSQLNSNLKIDTTFRRLSIFDYQQPFNLGIIKEYKSQTLGPFDNNLFFRHFPNKKLNFSQDSVEKMVKTRSYDNMPCLNPQGFFPMRVYKPDSTVRYSLRVEMIK